MSPMSQRPISRSKLQAPAESTPGRPSQAVSQSVAALSIVHALPVYSRQSCSSEKVFV